MRDEYDISSLSPRKNPYQGDDFWDSSSFPVLSEAEFIDHPESVCKQVQVRGPLKIQGNGGRILILIGWEDYWRKFGTLYPPGERERLEQEIKNSYVEENLR